MEILVVVFFLAFHFVMHGRILLQTERTVTSWDSHSLQRFLHEPIPFLSW